MPTVVVPWHWLNIHCSLSEWGRCFECLLGSQACHCAVQTGSLKKNNGSFQLSFADSWHGRQTEDNTESLSLSHWETFAVFFTFNIIYLRFSFRLTRRRKERSNLQIWLLLASSSSSHWTALAPFVPIQKISFWRKIFDVRKRFEPNLPMIGCFKKKWRLRCCRQVWFWVK